MATITNTVKFVTNVEELRAQLKLGEDQIIATRASATKLVESLGGDRLIAAAHRYAAAVSEIGGVANLTRAEQDRVNAVVTKAIEKYDALGKTAPTALRDLAESTRNLDEETKRFQQDSQKRWDGFSDRLSALGSVAKTVGAGLTAALTAPLVGAAVTAGKAAIDYESAFAGVRKTVAGTPAELQKINDQFRDMAKTMPASAVELAHIGEMAGQLGVKKESITAFAKTIVDISTATNLTADEAGSAFARLANVLKMPQDQFSNLGSAVVALGNFGASTEQEMLSMAQRIAAAGATANMTAPQILGIANALSSVGIEAEAGGTAVSRVINKIGTDVHTGGGHLQTFAKVAGMTSQEFQKAWRDDAGTAFSKFMQGLANARERGGDELLGLMDDLGFKEVRLRNAFMAAANAGTLMADSIALGTKAFNENTEVTRAAGERYQTAANQLKILWNNLTDVSITLGTAFLPMLVKSVEALIPAVQAVGDLAKEFAAAPGALQLMVLGLGALVAAAGPVLLGLGLLAGSIVKISALLVEFPAIGAAAATAFQAVTTGMTGMVAVGAGVVAAAAAVGTLTYALTRLADVASGGKLSGWLTPFLSGTEELAKQTQEAGAGADAMRLATERSGHVVRTMAEALQINTEWLKNHIAQARLATTAQTAFVGPLRASGEAAQTLAEKVKALTEAQRADIAAKVAQGYGIKAIAAETQIASDVVSAYLKQQHLVTTAGKAHAKALEEERAAHITLTAAQQERVKSLLALKLTDEEVARIAGVHVIQVRQYVAAQKEAADVEKFLLKVRLDAEKASGKLDEDAANKLHKRTDQIAHSMIEGVKLETAARLEARDVRLKAILGEYQFQQFKIGEWAATEKAKLAETVGNHTQAYADIEAIAADKFQALARAHQEALEEMKAQEFSWGKGFASLIGGIPTLLTQSLTGGGGMAGFGKALQSGVGALAGAGLTGPLTGLFNKAAPALLNHLGMTLTTAIGGAIPFIGPAIGALAPVVIGGFKKLFGGVSEEEKKGRESVQAFEKQIASTLTATQKLEAGNQGWKQTVVGVRDAYLATGHSAAEAETAITRLWASSKKSVAEQQAAQKAITDVMNLQKKAAEALPGILSDVAAGMNAIGKGTVGTLNETAAAIDKTKDGGQEAFKQLAVSGQEDFDRTGRLALSAFNAAIAGGKSFGEALTDLGPTFDELVKAQGTFGYTTSATLQDLLNFKNFASGPGKEVLSTLDGVNKLMGGLQKMGLLTQADFSDLSAVASETFGKMTKGGISGDQALRAMQPTLQKLWELEQDQGYTTDDNTQALINQAHEAGIVGDKLRDPQEQMLKVLQAIAKALGADLPEAAEKGAKGVKDALAKIPDHVDVGVNVGSPTIPEGGPRTAEAAATGGFVRALGIQHFDVGGIVKAAWRLPQTFAPIGTDIVPAMLTPGELILNQGQQAQIASLLEKGVQLAQGTMAGGKAAPVVLQEQFQFDFTITTIDGADLQQTVETKLMPSIVSVIEDRRRGFASRLQQALGTT